jgi:hypothetical protein
MRLGPSGQPAHIRVIRRRSRRVVALPRGLRTPPTPGPARCPRLRHPVGRAARRRGWPEPRGRTEVKENARR